MDWDEEEQRTNEIGQCDEIVTPQRTSEEMKQDTINYLTGTALIAKDTVSKYLNVINLPHGSFTNHFTFRQLQALVFAARDHIKDTHVFLNDPSLAQKSRFVLRNYFPLQISLLT